MLSKTHLKFEEEIQKNMVDRFHRFEKYQSLVLNVLEEFSRVCEKNDIKYFLAYGSLLGAIRDNGQIPWDYDIDTWVHFDDKDKLFKALEKDLSEDYYFVSRYYNNKNLHHRILRIAPKGYSSEVLHVDVFWIFGASGKPNIDRKEIKKMKKIRKISLFKYVDAKFINSPNSRAINFVNKIRQKICGLIPGFILDKIYDRCTKRSSINSPMVYDGFGLYVKSEWLKTNQWITIENGMRLSIPKEYDKILTSMYGDYKKYLPVEDRMTEFITALSRIERVGKL